MPSKVTLDELYKLCEHLLCSSVELNYISYIWTQNRLFDLVSDAESLDIKILTGFPGSPILEILIKIVIA